MEELLRETRKQLQFQKVITALLAVVAVVLVALVVILGSSLARMTISMEEAMQKIEELDVDGINHTIGNMQELFENVDELSDALDGVTARVQEFDSWISGIFGR